VGGLNRNHTRGRQPHGVGSGRRKTLEVGQFRELVAIDLQAPLDRHLDGLELLTVKASTTKETADTVVRFSRADTEVFQLRTEQHHTDVGRFLPKRIGAILNDRIKSLRCAHDCVS
jgi:hypothetical protein